METSASLAPIDPNYPPLPETGPPEDSELAKTNFMERERLSKSWRSRFLSKRRSSLTLLKKRTNVLGLNSGHTSSTESLDTTHEPSGAEAETAVSTAGHSETLTSEARTESPSEIFIRSPSEENPSRDQHLYCWAMVYENQRGISIFSTRRYSSRSLLPRDPPAISVVAPASSMINGRPIRKSLQPDISLEDYPLPDGNWRWASKEWLIDMRDETVQHDGFEYNWVFRSKGWRPRAGHLNAGAWVRRRRWIRLMERPPLSSLQEEEGSAQVAIVETISTSLDLNNVWHGDDEDWPRLRRALNVLGRDSRKLDGWEIWLGQANESPSDEHSSNLVINSMRTVLRSQMDELLHTFIYPSSRVEFLEMITKARVLSKNEVLGTSNSSPSFVDLPRLREALSTDDS